ncbi:aminopeptidase [archaeon]|nr:aminopeptidase [archaeon]
MLKKEWLAKKIVNYSMHIGQKSNPTYEKLKKKHRVLSKDSVKRVSKKDKKLFEKWQDIDYGPLVIKKGKKYEFKKKIGHTVLISYNPSTKKLAQAVERECWKNGAHTFSQETETARIKDSYLYKPTDSLRELDGTKRALFSNMDYYINLESIENIMWKKGVPPAKLSASAPVNQRISQIRDKSKERWLLVGWPHADTAKELGIGLSKFRQIVFHSIEESFKKHTFDLVWDYVRLLEGKKEVRIESKEGTDLTFSIKGRKILADDGFLSERDIANGDVGMNIPCGEAFCAPVETSADGTYIVPRNIIRGYGIAEGIKLKFSKGRVVDYSARKHEDYLNKFFKENTGDYDRIAELGIGCNRGAEFTNGYIIVDEKILGTLHVAIGWNIGFGGKNDASSHLDFIKPMQHGQLFVDNKLIMDKGKIVKR